MRVAFIQRLNIEVLCIVVVIGCSTFAVSKPHCPVYWKIIIADAVFNGTLIFLLTEQFLRNHSRRGKVLRSSLRVVAGAVDAVDDEVAKLKLRSPGLGLAGIFQ